MILITSFFKSFEFELNPIPKTDFLKKKIEYFYHLIHNQRLWADPGKLIQIFF